MKIFSVKNPLIKFRVNKLIGINSFYRNKSTLNNNRLDKTKIIKKHWYNYIIEVDNKLLDNTLILKAIKNFLKVKASLLNEDKHMLIMFRIQDKDGFWSTLGRLQKVNKDFLDYFMNFVTGILDIKSNEYKEMVIKRVAISFGIRSGKIDTKTIIEPIKMFQNYKHYNLPNTMNPMKYRKNVIKITKSIYVVPLAHQNIAKIKVINKNNKILS